VDFAARPAHRSHAVRSRPGGNRWKIARSSVMRAARRIAFASMVGSIEQQAGPASLLSFACDRSDTLAFATLEPQLAR
jgi:hypothetical protein